MKKCHCAGIDFGTIVEIAQQKKCSYTEVTKELGVSIICRACTDYVKTYCESNLK